MTRAIPGFAKVLMTLVLVLNLGGCEPPGGGGGGGGGKGEEQNDDADKGEAVEEVYRCKSEHERERTLACIADANKANAIAADVSTWTVPIGDWLSLLFQTKYFKAKHQTTEVETRCLIEQFCKEKVP